MAKEDTDLSKESLPTGERTAVVESPYAAVKRGWEDVNACLDITETNIQQLFGYAQRRDPVTNLPESKFYSIGSGNEGYIETEKARLRLAQQQYIVEARALGFRIPPFPKGTHAEIEQFFENLYQSAKAWVASETKKISTTLKETSNWAPTENVMTGQPLEADSMQRFKLLVAQADSPAPISAEQAQQWQQNRKRFAEVFGIVAEATWNTEYLADVYKNVNNVSLQLILKRVEDRYLDVLREKLRTLGMSLDTTSFTTFAPNWHIDEINQQIHKHVDFMKSHLSLDKYPESSMAQHLESLPKGSYAQLEYLKQLYEIGLSTISYRLEEEKKKQERERQRAEKERKHVAESRRIKRRQETPVKLFDRASEKAKRDYTLEETPPQRSFLDKCKDATQIIAHTAKEFVGCRVTFVDSLFSKLIGKHKQLENESKAYSSAVLEAAGLPEDVMDDWDDASGGNDESIFAAIQNVVRFVYFLGLNYNQDVNRFLNTERIKTLESIRPGITRTLYEEFGIRNLSRCSLEDMLAQYDNRNKAGEYILSTTAISDHNGALLASHPLGGIKAKLSLLGKTVRYIETGSGLELIEQFGTLQGRYGANQVEVLVGNAHGEKGTVHASENIGGMLYVSKSQHPELLPRLASIMKKNGTLLLASCSTGAMRGIAQDISKAWKDITVIGPSRVAAAPALIRNWEPWKKDKWSMKYMYAFSNVFKNGERVARYLPRILPF